MSSLKIFADGIKPDKNYIDNIIDKFKIEGFTCNPSLIKQFLPIDYKEYCLKILECSRGYPVSIQVLSNNKKEIDLQAKKISSWGKNVYVKIPIVNNEGISNVNLIKQLLSEGLKINVTAIFTLQQVESLLNAGVNLHDDCIISIFSGRISDTGIHPNEIIENIRSLIDTKGNVKLLWAGSRSIVDILYAKTFCDIITIPSAIIDKLKFKNKNLDEYTVETVQMFTNDSKCFVV